MKKNHENIAPTEPLYYVGMVLKGTEEQYLNLLRYIEKHGIQLIYQCKSLTYLYIVRENQQILTIKVNNPRKDLTEEK